VAERFMDSMDLEKERGITIQAKNASFNYKDVKVNIVDTPGHSDFGGEVERILNMVDGCLLLVDASEGPLPQTRFVLKKALEQNLKVIVVVNKIDRPDARINEVLDEVFNLFIDLDASEEQCYFKTVYTIAKNGLAALDPKDIDNAKDLTCLFETIIELVPPPKIETGGPLQILVSNISYSDYVGRMAIGRIQSGKIKVNDEVLVMHEKHNTKVKVKALFSYKASTQVQVQEMSAGDIAVVAGLEDVFIGDTITSVTEPKPLPRIKVDEPTVGMIFSVNDGPFAGKEGPNVTSRKLKERFEKEMLHNVALRMEDTGSTDSWKILGRGELQLSILLENMRREGYEVLVSKPQALYRKIDGELHEPMENVVIDVEDQFTGVVTQKLGMRRGVMTQMMSKGSGRTRLEFKIPSRGLFGYRSEFMTDTKGTGLMNTEFSGYEPYKGDIPGRTTGAMIADRAGRATPYALYHLEERGKHFIDANVQVYEGMVTGEHAKSNDIEINVTKEKKLTNHRASGSEEAIRLTTVKPMTLEQAMDWISDRELIEVTPKSIRIRCRTLDPHARLKEMKIERARDED
jgi:GTP-binding protein